MLNLFSFEMNNYINIYLIFCYIYILNIKYIIYNLFIIILSYIFSFSSSYKITFFLQSNFILKVHFFCNYFFFFFFFFIIIIFFYFNYHNDKFFIYETNILQYNEILYQFIIFL